MKLDNQQAYLLQALVTWLLNAAALMVTSGIIPGMWIQGFGTAMVASLVLAVCNILILPLLTVLTLPITVLTLGLFWFILNGAMLKMAAALLPGFRVGWLGAIVGAVVLTLIQGLFRWAFQTFA